MVCHDRDDHRLSITAPRYPIHGTVWMGTVRSKANVTSDTPTAGISRLRRFFSCIRDCDPGHTNVHATTCPGSSLPLYRPQSHELKGSRDRRADGARDRTARREKCERFRVSPSYGAQLSRCEHLAPSAPAMLRNACTLLGRRPGSVELTISHSPPSTSPSAFLRLQPVIFVLIIFIISEIHNGAYLGSFFYQ